MGTPSISAITVIGSGRARSAMKIKLAVDRREQICGDFVDSWLELANLVWV